MPLVDSVYFAGLPPVPGLELRPTSGCGPADAGVLVVGGATTPCCVTSRWTTCCWWNRGGSVLQPPAPGRATILATAQSGPVLAEVQERGVRQVIASFDLLKTNWPMQVSFAVFVSNFVAEFAGRREREDRPPVARP